jgi:hypothetical protein
MHSPPKYVCWKYIGETDGVLGCLTGKLNAGDPPGKISRGLAVIPFERDLYKVEANQESETPPPRKKNRDLFSLSIKNATREAARQRTLSRLSDEKAGLPPEASDTMIFMETDAKRVPLIISRMKKS